MNLCPYHYEIILLYYSLLIKKKKKLQKIMFIPAEIFQ